MTSNGAKAGDVVSVSFDRDRGRLLFCLNGAPCGAFGFKRSEAQALQRLRGSNSVHITSEEDGRAVAWRTSPLVLRGVLASVNTAHLTELRLHGLASLVDSALAPLASCSRLQRAYNKLAPQYRIDLNSVRRKSPTKK